MKPHLLEVLVSQAKVAVLEAFERNDGGCGQKGGARTLSQPLFLNF